MINAQTSVQSIAPNVAGIARSIMLHRLRGLRIRPAMMFAGKFIATAYAEMERLHNRLPMSGICRVSRDFK